MRLKPKPGKSELREQLKRMNKVAPTVAMMYKRVQATFPFPLEPMEVYDELLGKQLRAMMWRKMPVPNADLQAWAREFNMRSLMIMGTTLTVALDSEQRIADIVKSRDHMRRVFWMEFTRAVPMPNGQPALLLSTVSKIRPPIVDWYARTIRFSSRAERDLDLIRKVIAKSRVPDVLTRVWPELMGYADLQPKEEDIFDLVEVDEPPIQIKAGLGFGGETLQQQVAKVQEAFGAAIEVARPRVAHNIATATILPDSSPKIWVGWPMK